MRIVPKLLGNGDSLDRSYESANFPASRLFKRHSLMQLRPFLLISALFCATVSMTSGSASAGAENLGNPTKITLESKIIRSNVKRLGMNMSGQSYYDSGQMLRDLTFHNPGFEGEIWQTVLECKFVKGDSCADSDEWSWWPADFAKGGTFEFFWGAAKGQKGAIAGNTVAASAAHQGIWISFGKLAVHPQVGDYYIVRFKIPGNATSGWATNTTGGATISTEFHDLSPSSPGKQAVCLDASKLAQTASLTSGFDTWENKSFVQLNGTYTLSFRAKGIAGTRELSVNVTRLAQRYGNQTYFYRHIPLTNAWQDYKFTFNAKENGSITGPVQVVFSVNTSSVLLDDASLTEAASPDNPTAFRNAVVNRLRELRPGILRYMDNGTSFGSTVDNLIAPPFARERSGYSEGNKEQSDIPIGLHEFLVLCQSVKAEPWFTLPVAITPSEMRNLIQYLSGSPSTPYGAKRAALGQSVPWTKVFPVIHLELGNEVWNWGSFPGEGIPEAKAYGTRASEVFGAARATSGFEANKFDMILDGWYAVPYYTEHEFILNTHADTFDIGPYIFDTFNDASSNEAIFGPMFAEPELRDSRPNGLVPANAQLAAKSGLKLAVYEVNLGALSGTVDQTALDSVLPSLGAGLAVSEHMLLMLRDDGIVNQALFCLPEYANGFFNPNHPGSKDLMKLWGTVVDMGGQTNRVRPTFLAEELANSAIQGNMIDAVQSGANPTWDQPESNNAVLDNKIPLKGAHLIQSFAFQDGAHLSLAVFNLSRSAALPITLSGPIAPHSKVEVSRLTSAHITDTNETAQTVSITHETLVNFNPEAPYSLPPYSMTVLTWETSGNRSSGSQPATRTSASHLKP